MRVEGPWACPCVRGVHRPGQAWNQLCHSNSEHVHLPLLHRALVLWLIFKKSSWKHSLPFLKEWEEDILLCLKVSSWPEDLGGLLSRWCCVCRRGAAAPKALQSCTGPAPGRPGPSTGIYQVPAWGCRAWERVRCPWITKDSKTRDVSQKSLCPELGYMSHARSLSWKQVSSNFLWQSSAGLTLRIRKQKNL